MNIRRIYDPKVQLSVWIIGIVLTLTALMFPPWVFACNLDASDVHIHKSIPGPFAPVFASPPVPVDKQDTDGSKWTSGISSELFYPQVDVIRLVVVLLAIGVVCGIPIVVIRNRLL